MKKKTKQKNRTELIIKANPAPQSQTVGQAPQSQLQQTCKLELEV